MNKGYIKVVLALLSITGYMQNIAFASDSATTTNSSNEEAEQILYNDPEEVQHLICDDPEEARQAEALMADVLDIAQEHANDVDNYSLYYKIDKGAILYSKYIDGVEVGKLELIVPNPDSYDDMINLIWDPNSGRNFNDSFVGGSVSKIYNQNLVIVQQRYTNYTGSGYRYFYALAKKVKLSEDETAILLVSSDMNDHDGRNNSEYINPIVESANSFKPDVNSEEDIRNGELYKMYINIAAFFFKKEADYVKVTYLSSLDANIICIIPHYFVKRAKFNRMLNIAKLRDIFKKE
ncbi:fam-a protein [Plasmodium chabaudi adami]|uniref:Fam-a protein n=1 Tax=Plasmodium chabaudi adami TaxID=5826 RepID=A0A1D3L8I4_PLACE|nr:fam-a protein [Plasmodium chabaudi adami]